MEPDNQSAELTIINFPQVWDLEPDERPECSIYRVPQNLRNVNEDAYTPKNISIGPFHYDNENLKKMELLKERYFFNACHRTKRSEKDLVKFIQDKEVDIRRHYAEIFLNLSSKVFVKMIVLDSIFIIEHLWRTKQEWLKSSGSDSTHKYTCGVGACVLITCKKEHGNPNDGDEEEENPEENDIQEKQNPRQSYDILRDLILLENQVPFFVLEELYNSAYREIPDSHRRCQQNKYKSFRKLVLDYFLHFWNDSGLHCTSDSMKLLCGREMQVRHLTDFLRYCLLPPNRKFGKSIRRLPSATKLVEAGVDFKEVKNRSLLDIKFQKGYLLEKCPCLNLAWLMSCFPCFKCLKNTQPILEIPSFTVGQATECIIRNLMAFEQCRHPGEAYICNYIVLLDHLIYTAEDVDLLVEKRVLVNWLGNNETVATLINNLCHQIVEGNHSCYYDISERINKHYMSPWSKLMASLKSQFFTDFWRGTITLAGIVALFFAVWSFVTSFHR